MTSEKSNKMRGLMGKRARAGSYSAFACAIVIALCVLVNGFFASLPSSVTQLDLTSQSLYSLSDQTKRIVRSVDNDVNLYILATTGYEDASIMRLLERYADLNDHIKVTPVDPAVKPTFLDAYDLSVSQLYENSVLVDANGRYRLVSYPDIYVTDYQMDYYSYNY
ncbi:MAG: Gldg family protein, partial [Clostridia bacterium]|nr:Gldg family protein [Clostridia bacterium]